MLPFLSIIYYFLIDEWSRICLPRVAWYVISTVHQLRIVLSKTITRNSENIVYVKPTPISLSIFLSHAQNRPLNVHIFI